MLLDDEHQGRWVRPKYYYPKFSRVSFPLELGKTYVHDCGYAIVAQTKEPGGRKNSLSFVFPWEVLLCLDNKRTNYEFLCTNLVSGGTRIVSSTLTTDSWNQFRFYELDENITSIIEAKGSMRYYPNRVWFRGQTF